MCRHYLGTATAYSPYHIFNRDLQPPQPALGQFNIIAGAGTPRFSQTLHLASGPMAGNVYVTWATPGINTISWEMPVSSVAAGISGTFSGAFTRAIEAGSVTDFGPIEALFPDNNLAQAVADTLGKQVTDHLTYYDVFGNDADILPLTNLDASGKDIVDLRGIGILSQLVTLDLSNNNIQNLGPIASLINLKQLNLDDNNISDLTPLASLKSSLSLLSLNRNHITNLEPLYRLGGIFEIRAEGQTITLADVTVGTTTRAEVFNRVDPTIATPIALTLPSNTGIFDNGFLTWMTADTLEVSWNETIPNTTGTSIFSGVFTQTAVAEVLQWTIGDLFPDPVLARAVANALRKSVEHTTNEAELATITALDTLSSMITLVEGVEQTVFIADLKGPVLLDDTRPNFNGIAMLPNLTTLLINNAAITDYAPLSQLSNLEFISIENSGFTNEDVAFLKTSQDNIVFLDLSNDKLSGTVNPTLAFNQINDGTLFTEFPNLLALVLYDNQIGDMNFLANLPIGLMGVGLRNNQIEDITPVAALPNLILIDFSYNKITDISPLAELPNLQQVIIRNNAISDISALSHMLVSGAVIFVDAQMQVVPRDAVKMNTPIPLEVLEIDGTPPAFNRWGWYDGATPAQESFGAFTVDDTGAFVTYHVARDNDGAVWEAWQTIEQQQAPFVLPILLAQTMGRNVPLPSQPSEPAQHVRPDFESLVRSSPRARTGIGIMPFATNYTGVYFSGRVVQRSGITLSSIFPDEALAQAVADTLQEILDKTINPNETILLPDELAEITSLDLSNKGIQNITGLDNLTNLQQLNLDNNQISDLRPLAQLPNVVYTANDQTIQLPDVPVGTPTEIVIYDIDGSSVALHPENGTHENGELIWDTAGDHQVPFGDDLFTGIVSQVATEEEKEEPSTLDSVYPS